MKNEVHPMRAKFEELLKLQGDLYTFDDVLDHIGRGLMQSFARDDTWVVTQVHVFPCKKVVEIAYVTGDRGLVNELESEVVEFAKSIGASMIIATGRFGWSKDMLPGWRKATVNYVREL